MVKGKLLIADDEVVLAQTLQNVLEAEYQIAICERGEEFIRILNEYNPDVVLLDIFLGKVNGLQLLKKMKEDTWVVPVIMMTAHADVSLAVEAMKEGAADFVIKPFDLNHLSVLIEKAMEQSRLKKKLQILESELQSQRESGGIIGKSQAIQRILETAAKLAGSENTTVLIEGESGTGKELFARYIYQNSPRRDKPFITLNCGAIPQNLAESEFFGYEKGAFTGATERMRQGKFELAEGGTIFLDEIGELSLDMQVKLLRVLEERRFYRLGGSREIEVDVRVLSASNRDLLKEVECGRFREDLFYRLNVASIKIPPLRTRRGDIAVIAKAFLHEFASRFAKPTPGLSPEAKLLIDNYGWKGNVRELRNAIERVVLLNSDAVIKPEHFDFLGGGTVVHHTVSQNNNEYRLEIPSSGIKMGQVIKDLILKTLEITNGNQVQAAKVLGVTRSKLRYRMDQLGIQPEQRSYRVQNTTESQFQDA